MMRIRPPLPVLPARARTGLLGLLAIGLLLTACGGGAPNRPELVASWPNHGDVLTGYVGEVSLQYDEPVRILNGTQVVVLFDGGSIPVFAVSDPVDATIVRIRPNFGAGFGLGAHTVRVEPGLVVNTNDQYALEDEFIDFDIAAPALFVGRPGEVAELDPDTFALGDVLATPGARAPVGLTTSRIGTDTRIWVQLADGGGAAASLASFTPGAAMTTVPLTVSAAGDLVATRDAIVTSADGRTIYAAFRDTVAMRVRLHRVDATTGLETGSLLLSPASSAATEPLGLDVGIDGASIFVACAAAAGARLVEVDTGTFTETDRGPDVGIDGLPLPEGAGLLAAIPDGRQVVAPEGNVTAYMTEILDLAGGTVVEVPDVTTGTPDTLVATRDGLWVVEGLMGYAGGLGLVAWPRDDFNAAEAVVISDLTTGADPAASSVRTGVADPASNRLLFFLDDETVVAFGWTDVDLVQLDLDDVTAGVQAIDLTTVWTGITVAAFVRGAVSP